MRQRRRKRGSLERDIQRNKERDETEAGKVAVRGRDGERVKRGQRQKETNERGGRTRQR